MNEQLITSKIHQLDSEALQNELLLFLDYLLAKQNEERTGEKPKKTPKFGCAKGTFKMVEDFDEPLEDFKDYM